MSIKTILLVVYIIIGFFVAQDHHYLANLDSIARVLSAILGVLLWPLVVLGVDLHIGSLPDVDIRNKKGK